MMENSIIREFCCSWLRDEGSGDQICQISGITGQEGPSTPFLDFAREAENKKQDGSGAHDDQIDPDLVSDGQRIHRGGNAQNEENIEDI